jgi:hypothetical protein
MAMACPSDEHPAHPDVLPVDARALAVWTRAGAWST